MTPEAALERAGFALASGHPAVANYVMSVRAGPLLFISGHGAFEDGEAAHTGKLGAGVNVEDGRKAAEAARGSGRERWRRGGRGSR